jgi:hypothetical protein
VAANKDAVLKRHVCDVLTNCRLDKSYIDREVHLNWDGETDEHGNLVAQKEVDVVAKFRYADKHILLFFECEDSITSSPVKEHYKGYSAAVEDILEQKASVKVVGSAENVIEGKHFRDVDEIHVCFVYGQDFPAAKFTPRKVEGEKHGFLVWNCMALQYYRRISSTLGAWTRYELFKDFSISHEAASTVDIPALRLKQKGHTMYLASIHPGLLLKIGYVVRRATEKTYAYQRMLNERADQGDPRVHFKL